MTTAGSVGFINLLPVYLDHILYPLLTVWLVAYTPLVQSICHNSM